MERPNTVSGLIAKHREVAGQIEHHRRILNNLAEDLDALEHAIRLFDPEAELGRAKPVHTQDQALKGEMRRDVLNTLREADKPLTSLDVAKLVLQARELPQTAENVTLFRKRVGAALWKLKTRGMAREIPLVGDYKGWELVR